MAGWRAWVADRFGLGPIADNVLNRRVAKGAWYYGDGAALTLLLGVLVVTGAVMALTYSPTPDSAYASVREITERQPLGWMVRGLHYWSAGFMVVMVFWHLLRQILVGGYKSPREGAWLVGVVMLVLVVVMSFTGYVLRWDQRGLHGLKVALHAAARVPVIGHDLVRLIQGGPEVSATTATRLYAVHVILIPLALLALAAFHVYLVILHGITSPLEKRRPVRTAEEQRRLYEEQKESDTYGETFFPDTVAKSGAMAVAVFLIVLGLTLVVGPRALMAEGDLVSRSVPAEEWWFWWVSALAALLPPRLAPAFYVIVPIVVVLALVALPFVDRRPYRGMRRRPVAVGAVVVTVLAVLYLSDLRRTSAWTGWPSDTPPPVPEGIELPPRAEAGRVLFARYGCNSCHAVAGHGPAFGPDLSRLPVPYPRSEMRDYVLRPPPGVPMPAYEGRIAPDELERLVDYIHAAQAFPRR